MLSLNQPLLKFTTSTWSMSTSETEWKLLLDELLYFQLDEKNCSFICLTWPFSTAGFCHQLQKPICQRNCHLCLVRNLIDKAGKLRYLLLLTKGRPSNAAKTVDHHALTNSDHWLVWPVKGNRLRYCAHSTQTVHSQTAYRLYEIWSGTMCSSQK